MRRRIERNWKTGHQAILQKLLLEFLLGDRLRGGRLLYALIQQPECRVNDFALDARNTPRITTIWTMESAENKIARSDLVQESAGAWRK